MRLIDLTEHFAPTRFGATPIPAHPDTAMRAVAELEGVAAAISAQAILSRPQLRLKSHSNEG